MYFCVDRIDDEFAMLISDEGERIRIGLSKLPEGIRESSILTRSPAGYVMDEAEEKKRRDKTRKLLDKMFE
ncbi:MAG: DUF3006 domain-containing protein [Eubacteriales bacterium]